jgi:hypothetical protein
MKMKITSKKFFATVICIVIVCVVYISLNQFFNNKENSLKITSMELTKSDGESNITMTVKIQNTGRNNINNAELHFILIKDNDIVDSEIQSLNLETNVEGTYRANFIDVTFKTDTIYKAIASIYLENDILDTKTITKLF